MTDFKIFAILVGAAITFTLQNWLDARWYVSIASGIVGYIIARFMSFAARSRRWTSNTARSEPKNFQNAQKNYQRYLALARAEVQIGNTVGAENYYQYAEHYFRSMSPDSEGT
jgi:uncharacterized protein DUF4167